MGTKIEFAPDCMKAQDQAKNLQPGQVLLLENLRFYAEKKANQEDLQDDASDEVKRKQRQKSKESQKEFTKTLFLRRLLH